MYRIISFALSEFLRIFTIENEARQASQIGIWLKAGRIRIGSPDDNAAIAAPLTCLPHRLYGCPDLSGNVSDFFLAGKSHDQVKIAFLGSANDTIPASAIFQNTANFLQKTIARAVSIKLFTSRYSGTY
jgi:hypothetical protein